MFAKQPWRIVLKDVAHMVLRQCASAVCVYGTQAMCERCVCVYGTQAMCERCVCVCVCAVEFEDFAVESQSDRS